MAVLLDNSGNTGGASKFSGTAANLEQKVGSQFTPTAAWTIASIDIQCNEDTGDPGGNASTAYDVEVIIQGDTAGHLPDDTNIIASAFCAHNAVNNGVTFVNVNVPIVASLVAGTKYWITFRTRSARDDANLYSTQGIVSSGTGARFANGTGVDTWAASTLDLYYILNGTGPGGTTTPAPTLPFLGAG